MGKPWNGRGGRSKEVRKIQRHLIVCEDKNSGADYLRAFKVPEEFAEVVVKGGAGTPSSVVNKALRLREDAEECSTPYAKVWCVFDRDPVGGTLVNQDDAIAKDFRKAFELAKPYQDVKVIWANECFELWYLLHYEFRSTGIGREELYAELSKPTRLGKKYNKSDKSVFELLKGKVETAKKNAKKLLADYGANLNPVKDNPSTNLHLLVTVLQELEKIAKA